MTCKGGLYLDFFKKKKFYQIGSKAYLEPTAICTMKFFRKIR